MTHNPVVNVDTRLTEARTLGAPSADLEALPLDQAPLDPLPAPTGTAGEALARARARAGLSLEMVARRSRVPLTALMALEADRPEDLPAMVYARGFMRLYAREVGLDPELPVALLEARLGAEEAAEEAASAEAERQARETRLERLRMAGGYSMAVAALIAVVLGALFSFDPQPLEARDLVSAPVTAPADSAARHDDLLPLDPHHP